MREGEYGVSRPLGLRLRPEREEPQHLPRRVRTFGVDVRTLVTAARPSMGGAVDEPVLRDDAPGVVAVESSSERMAVRDLPVFHLGTRGARRCIASWDPRKNKPGVRAGGRSGGPVVGPAGGRTRKPGGARRRCSALPRVEQPRAWCQAGVSLEPRTALTRSRAGAGRWPGRGEEAWREGAGARGWPGRLWSEGRRRRRVECSRSAGR
jgi:hypothetical protein